jgi:hypothetical protein
MMRPHDATMLCLLLGTDGTLMCEAGFTRSRDLPSRMRAPMTSTAADPPAAAPSLLACALGRWDVKRGSHFDARARVRWRAGLGARAPRAPMTSRRRKCEAGFTRRPRARRPRAAESRLRLVAARPLPPCAPARALVLSDCEAGFTLSAATVRARRSSACASSGLIVRDVVACRICSALSRASLRNWSAMTSTGSWSSECEAGFDKSSARVSRNRRTFARTVSYGIGRASSMPSTWPLLSAR